MQGTWISPKNARSIAVAESRIKKSRLGSWICFLESKYLCSSPLSSLPSGPHVPGYPRVLDNRDDTSHFTPLLQKGSLEIQMGMDMEVLCHYHFLYKYKSLLLLLIALKIFSVIKAVGGSPRLVVDSRKTNLAPRAGRGQYILPAFEGWFSAFRALSSYYLARRGHFRGPAL